MSQPTSVDQKNPNRSRTVLLATNNSQSIIGEVVDGKANAIAYSAYGHLSGQQEVATQLGFNGQLREANIGWYLLGNGYRAYNPRLMRFHSPDSWSPFGRGGLNPYMYCVGDPVNRSDPTGHVFSFNRMTSFFRTLGPGKSRPVDLNKLDLSGAMQMLGEAHNARINYVAPPTRSSEMSDILYTLGTSHRMPGGSPAISDIGPTTARHHPGYAGGAAMSGLTHRSTRPTPQASSLSGGRRNVPRSDKPPKYEPPPSYEETMPLWNADTFAGSQQPQNYTVNRMAVARADNLGAAAPFQAPAGAPPPPLVVEQNQLLGALAELNAMQREVIQIRASGSRCRIL